MATAHDAVTPAMEEFVAAQHVFFVATAPTEGGHVNLSPKGLDCFRLLGPDRVAYLDLTGSGAETIAHVRENGRITLMFCAFEGPPKIVRLYGAAVALLPGEPRFEELRPLFGERRGVRSIIEARIDRTSDSCGYSVPRMAFVEDRSTLEKWVAGKSDAEIAAYQEKNNQLSIDGLPALASGGR